MKRLLPLMILLALGLVFLALRQKPAETPTMNPNGSLAQALPPRPPIAPRQSIEQAKPEKIAVLKQTGRHSTKWTKPQTSSEALLNEASKRIVAQTKVPTAVVPAAPVSQKVDRFNSRLGRMRTERRAEPVKDLCDTEACQASQQGYTLVGLVVSTSPVRGADSKYFGGDLDVGDAKRKPLVYVK